MPVLFPVGQSGDRVPFHVILWSAEQGFKWKWLVLSMGAAALLIQAGVLIPENQGNDLRGFILPLSLYPDGFWVFSQSGSHVVGRSQWFVPFDLGFGLGLYGRKEAKSFQLNANPGVR